MQNENRDFLANERTFLAYIRTALAFVAFGFVVARFALFMREISAVAHVRIANSHASTVFGAAMAAAGIAVGIYGCIRYVKMNAAINTQRAEAMPAWAAVFGATVVAAIGIVVAFALFEVR